MIYKQLSPKPAHVRIVFELPSDLWADRVALVGDFNAWNPTATPLTQDRAGVWRAAVDVPAHTRYAFHYLVDGHWRADYQADGWAYDPGGRLSSTVEATLAVQQNRRQRRERAAIANRRRSPRFPLSPNFSPQ